MLDIQKTWRLQTVWTKS